MWLCMLTHARVSMSAGAHGLDLQHTAHLLAHVHDALQAELGAHCGLYNAGSVFYSSTERRAGSQQVPQLVRFGRRILPGSAVSIAFTEFDFHAAKMLQGGCRQLTVATPCCPAPVSAMMRCLPMRRHSSTCTPAASS